MKPLFRSKSTLGDSAFYDKNIFRPSKELESSYPIIREELDGIMERVDEFAPFQDISPDQTRISNDDKWKMFFLKAANIRFDRNCLSMPRTMEILDKYPEIVSVYFSVLGPRKILIPHEGPWSGVLRMHMGMIIPGDGEGCVLVCDNKPYYWKEGEVVVFDDTYEHFAANFTDEFRVILFIDILRPLPFLMDKLNKLILWASRFIPYIREPLRRHRKWEKGFYSD